MRAHAQLSYTNICRYHIEEIIGTLLYIYRNCFMLGVPASYNKLESIQMLFRLPVFLSSFVLTTVHNYFPLSGNRSLFRLHERSSPANCSFNGVTISSSSKDNVASAILLTHSPLPQPRSQGFSWFKIG